MARIRDQASFGPFNQVFAPVADGAGGNADELRPTATHAPNPDAVTAEDRAVYAEGLKTPNGISGSVGWYRATFQTARQIRTLGDKGISVPMMAWGGEFGIPITHSQFEMISSDVRGGVIPSVGHLIPEEAPEFLAKELDAFYDELENG